MKVSVPHASFAKVLLLTRSQVKMSFSTVVDLDALTSGTMSTFGNDVRLYDLFAGTLSATLPPPQFFFRDQYLSFLNLRVGRTAVEVSLFM